MQGRLWIQIGAMILAVGLGVAIVDAWRADRRDRAQLASELAATKKALADADSRQRERDAQLTQTLAGLAAQKRAVNTPAQIVRELPHEIPFPVPIEPQYPTESKPPVSQISGQPNPNPSTLTTNDAKPLQAVIPAEDLKPLYDFALDCKACQARLISTQSDLSDEKAKTVALTHERDDALRLARGATVLHRIGPAAKWLAIGAVTGVLAAKASH